MHYPAPVAQRLTTDSITAANVQMVRGAMIDGPTPRSETSEYLELIDFNAANISPSPGGAMESYPPYWT